VIQFHPPVCKFRGGKKGTATENIVDSSKGEKGKRSTEKRKKNACDAGNDKRGGAKHKILQVQPRKTKGTARKEGTLETGGN